MFIIIPGAFNAQTGVPGGSQQGQIVTVGSILKVTERDRRPYPTDAGTPSEIWIDNTAGIGYICKEFDTGNGTVWDRLDLLGDFVTFGDSDPGVNIDIKLGYRPGSLRYARNSEILWICKDNTQGAAVWDVLSSGGGVVSVNGLTGVVQLYLDDILDVNVPLPNNGDVLTWDSVTSTWIALAPTGGPSTPYTVDNGLTESPTNNFQLGGALIKDTTVNTASYLMTFIGDRFNFPIVYIENTAATGAGLAVKSNNISIQLISNNPSLDTIQPSIELTRLAPGIVSSGIGQSINFRNKTLSGSNYEANRIISQITNVAPGSFTSNMIFTGTLNAVPKNILTLLGTGQLQLNNYTGTTFDGTAVKALGVDASGNVITTTGGGGGGITELTDDVTTPALSSGVTAATLKPNLRIGSFGVTVDGVSSIIQVGQTGFVTMPYSGTLTGWSISANAIGSIQFNIWKAAGAIPVLLDSIVASAPPTLTTAQFITSTTMTAWTTTFAAGDVFGFYVNSVTGLKNATLTLRCTKT